MPLPLYAGLSGRLLTTLLKAKRFTGVQRLAVLKRVVKRLRTAWPDPRWLLRGDRHFASPEVLQWIEDPHALHYVTGLTSNAVLQELAREVGAQAKRASASRGRQVPRCHSTRYQARPWWRSRRVVSQGAVSEQGVNTRFVVTDMEHARTQVLSQHISCARGQAENDSKDHKRYLKSDRTAGHRFAAKQWRVLVHAAASVFLETLRREVFRTTQWASAPRETIQ